MCTVISAKGSLRERRPGNWELIVQLPRDAATGKPKQLSRSHIGTKREAQRALVALVAQVAEQDSVVVDHLERATRPVARPGRQPTVADDCSRVSTDREPSARTRPRPTASQQGHDAADRRVLRSAHTRTRSLSRHSSPRTRHPPRLARPGGEVGLDSGQPGRQRIATQAANQGDHAPVARRHAQALGRRRRVRRRTDRSARNLRNRATRPLRSRVRRQRGREDREGCGHRRPLRAARPTALCPIAQVAGGQFSAAEPEPKRRERKNRPRRRTRRPRPAGEPDTA